jgi:hypothetical protein
VKVPALCRDFIFSTQNDSPGGSAYANTEEWSLEKRYDKGVLAQYSGAQTGPCCRDTYPDGAGRDWIGGSRHIAER